MLVALWLLEGSSAFWGGRFGRHPYTLRTELLAAFAPRRGAVARRAEDRAELLGCGLPFFAPAEWTGAFAFGGRGGSGGKLTTVSIVCLPPGKECGSGTDLTITTEAEARDEDGVRWHLFRPNEGEAVWQPLVLRVDGRDLSGGASNTRVAAIATRASMTAG
ncbi:hypothetical protein [Gryllotalpicola koreensis]|uniref:DUF1214 domain-containing protein n=1 Tax=Gryllotalpicola koreensis TaxID=993086 RepID=A0ABP7ZYZ2_9MICO